MENSMRDRGSMVVPSGIPDYLKFKSKRIQTAVLAKNKVRDDILCVANVTSGAILKGRFSSQNFIDPQSVRLVFTMSTSANAPIFKFHNDAGLNAIIKSLRVTSGSTQVEWIQNYNLLMTMLYSVSVSNDWKKTLGWVEGFGTDINAGTADYKVSCPDFENMTGAGSVNFCLPIHSGLFSMNERLIPNSSLNLVLDIELASARSVFTSTAGDQTYVLNNVALEYDEYVVSEAYTAVYQQALLNSITFDYTTFSNINVVLGTGNTINTISTDSQKQLRSIYTIVRDAATPAAVDFKNQTDLESIAGEQMGEFQYRIGTQMVPLYKVKNLQEAYVMTLDSFNRANVKRDDYPLTYAKYNGLIGRRFFVGVDVEKSKTASSEFYSGLNTNSLQLQFTMTIKNTAATVCAAGSKDLAALTVANGAGGFIVDHFLLHDRIITIGGGQIIVDF